MYFFGEINVTTILTFDSSEKHNKILFFSDDFECEFTERNKKTESDSSYVFTCLVNKTEDVAANKLQILKPGSFTDVQALRIETITSDSRWAPEISVSI